MVEGGCLVGCRFARTAGLVPVPAMRWIMSVWVRAMPPPNAVARGGGLPPPRANPPYLLVCDRHEDVEPSRPDGRHHRSDDPDHGRESKVDTHLRPRQGQIGEALVA